MKQILRLSLAVLVAAAMTACGTPPAHQSALRSTAATITQQQAPQVQRAAIAKGIYELVYSPHQNALFVASSGGPADQSKILRLNPQTLAIESETVLERKAFGLALDDDDNHLYIGNSIDSSITVLDTRSEHVLHTIQLSEKVRFTGPDGKEVERYPRRLRELVLDKGNHWLYVLGLGGYSDESVLYVVDTRALAVQKVIPALGPLATGITFDEQAGKVYVSSLFGKLFTIDVKTLELEKTSEVAADQLLNLVLDHSRNRILATDEGIVRVNEDLQKNGHQLRGEGNRVVAINPADGQILTSVPTGEGPVALLLDTQRNALYVTNRASGTVTVYAADDYRLLHTISLPTHPNSLALDEKTGTVFVSVKNGEKDAKGSNESVVRIQF